jgi:predicted nucleotidyltransferase
MQTVTIESVKKNGWLIFEGIVGSKAYGLDTASSDTDIKGVFILPQELFYSLDYIPQVSNETNDIVYFELKRFIELLAKNNPNILELLALPDECVLYRHPLMERIQSTIFLSRLCEQTFANYAYAQIKKAWGLEKKMANPVEPGRKSVLDFCYVYADDQSLPFSTFLLNRNWQQENIGLRSVAHLRDCYEMFYNSDGSYGGILKKESANDITLSSISSHANPVGLLYFNKDGYSVYCKKYKEYWNWVAQRNVTRYTQNQQHGKNYDAKNMMHVFRLLMMAQEIALEQRINVRRTDREFLLAIKRGYFEYEDLLERAKAIQLKLPGLFEQSGLPPTPDIPRINDLLINIRMAYYQ